SRWKRRLVYLLTIIAIGGTGFSGWWTLHEKRTHEARQTEILESLGKFIDEGQRLQTGLVASPATPVQEAVIADWMQRTANYLNGMGTSYVIRFMSNAGLENGQAVWTKATLIIGMLFACAWCVFTASRRKSRGSGRATQRRRGTAAKGLCQSSICPLVPCMVTLVGTVKSFNPTSGYGHGGGKDTPIG